MAVDMPPLPTPPATHPEVDTLKTKAFVFGIISLLTFFWLPPVGIGFGIAALVVTSKARKQSIALAEQPPRTFVAQWAMGLVGVIGGSLALIVAIFVTSAALLTIGGAVTEAVKGQNGYSSRIEAFSSAKKDFTAGQKIEYGPYDLTITGLQKNYTLSEKEAPVINNAVTKAQDDTYYSQNNTFGQDIPAASRVYTKFTINIAYSAERAKLYDKISMDLPSWGNALRQLTLEGKECIWQSATQKDLRIYNNSYTDEHKQPGTNTYICITDTADPLAIELTVSAFSKVSAIVGTEGMPRQKFTYTIQL